MTPVVLALFITLSSSQFNLWQDYLKNSEEQVKKHQQLNPGVQENDKANFSEVEGVSLLRPDESFNQMYKPFVEHANFFVMIHLLFNYKIPVDLLFLLFCVSLLAVVFIFFYFQKYRSSKYSLENYILIGFCLYMLSDLFSPVYRGQYNTIQWIFPLFLVPITFQKKYGWLYFCIFLAFVLNIHYKPFILMQHTLGEYIWLSSFLIYAFLFERNHADISTNVSLSGAMK